MLLTVSQHTLGRACASQHALGRGMVYIPACTGRVCVCPGGDSVPSGGVCPGGCLPGAGVKTLPCRNFVAGGKYVILLIAIHVEWLSRYITQLEKIFMQNYYVIN